MPDYESLRSAVSGPVLTPSDPGFADEARGFNLFYTHTPEVVVGVTDEADAVAAVRFAHDNGMHVDVLSTGHGSHATVDNGMLITTRRLNSLVVDPDARTATIGAGVRWQTVVDAAAPHGLAPITGSSSNVGVVGYILGGGVGPLARSHGYSSDYLRSLTVVTASGDMVEASADSNPELFWALRGGKGGLGLVLSVTIELVAIPSLYGGSLIFTEENIEAAYRGWVDYTVTAHDDVTTSAAIFHFPPLEVVPEPFRGQTLLMVRFAFPGDVAEGERLVAPLRDAAPVYLDSVRPLPLAEVATIHNDPNDPSPSYSRGVGLTAIDQNFASVVLGAFGAGTHGPIMILEVRHLGSATSRDVAGGSAAGGRSVGFTAFLIGAPDPSLFGEILPAATDGVLAAIAPWIASETLINFAAADGAEEFRKSWPADTTARLEAERATVDPDGTFAYGPVRG